MCEFKECFANSGKGKECRILTEKSCETKGKCKFCKSHLQFTAGQAIAKERNRKLGILSESNKYETDNPTRKNHFNKVKEEIRR